MMQKFRQLTKNFFFKVILAFVAVSFVTFGINGFLAGGNKSWVVKIGDETISYNDYNYALQTNKDMVLVNNKSDEALGYVNSDQFRSEVLSLVVKKKMFEIVHDEFDFVPDRDQVLKKVVRDPRFQDVDGNFDRKIFDELLANNNLSESKYVEEIARDTATKIIANSLSGIFLANQDLAIEEKKFESEQRFADLIKINFQHLKKVKKPNSEEVAKFFEENRDKFKAPEYRSISYLSFAKSDFAKDYAVTDLEVRKHFDDNRLDYKSDEMRNFYHILFDEESVANEFLAKLNQALGDKARAFASLAKSELNQDKEVINMVDITKKDFLPELSEQIFQLQIGEVSEVIKSEIGFHLAIVNSVTKPKQLKFSQVKDKIADSLKQRKEENILDQKIAEIDDQLLTTNSVVKVAKSSNLKYNRSPITIDAKGSDVQGKKVETKGFVSEFIDQSFALKEGQISKIFYHKLEDKYYALQLDKIIPTRNKELKEVRSDIVKYLHNQAKQKELAILSEKVAKEVSDSPKSISRIARKYKVSYVKNSQFPRIYKINFQGKEMPYQDQFLKDLFNMQVGEVTGAVQTSAKEFVIARLKKVKRSKLNDEQITTAKNEYRARFKNEIMQELDRMLGQKHPIEINRSLLKSTE